MAATKKEKKPKAHDLDSPLTHEHPEPDGEPPTRRITSGGNGPLIYPPQRGRFPEIKEQREAWADCYNSRSFSCGKHAGDSLLEASRLFNSIHDAFKREGLKNDTNSRVD